MYKKQYISIKFGSLLLQILFIALRLGLEPQKVIKKSGACPARVAEAGQENIETVHEPKPIQAADTL